MCEDSGVAVGAQGLPGNAWAPDARRYAELKETHSAVVVLLGDRAYKVKKPVDLGFLDFTSRDQRLRVSEREVELNRRLSPDVYLGVGRLRLPDGGEEPVVVMRRMPADRRLATLVSDGAPVDADLRELAHQLAGFHSRSERSPHIDAEGGVGRLRSRWTDSFRQVAPFHGRVLDPAEGRDIERLTHRFLDGRAALFETRVDRGCIVDGHGDLTAEDVFCLLDEPRILDCLEFDDRLRYVDRVDDAAFLAMDLERLGAGEQAARFLDWYLELAGDWAPPALVHHYIAYRAFVRAKVACLRFAQGRDEAGREARALAALTHRHLVDAAVTLVLVGGLPGTGKTTLSGAMADRYGMVVLSSDRVRKELAGITPEQAAASGYREGLYAPERTRRTYQELLRRAEALLGMGESVILDASWTDQEQRAAARVLAQRCTADLVQLQCQAPMDVTAARFASRQGPSDADATTAARMAEDMPPWPDASVVDTTVSIDASLHVAGAVLGRRQPLTRRVRS